MSVNNTSKLYFCTPSSIQKHIEYSTAHEYAQVMEFQSYMPYIIEDNNHDIYVGIHLYDMNKSLEQNLDVCMQEHLNENVDDNKKSPVLKMVNPMIRPYDKKHKEPKLLYGNIEHILRFEKELKTLMYNDVIDSKLETVVVIDELIKRLDEKIVIETTPHPTPKNPDRKTYIINSRCLCRHLERNVVSWVF